MGVELRMMLRVFVEIELERLFCQEYEWLPLPKQLPLLMPRQADYEKGV